ncbi:MAG: hypothetical protein ACUVRM_11065 [Bacillota bacterium]
MSLRKAAPKALLLLALASVLAGCFGGGGGSGGGSTVKVYGGSMPIGDYVAVTVDKTNQTVTYHNYTTGESAGPYSYSRLTTDNWGFQNIYKTQTFTGPENKQCYADFIVMEGVALIFQLFDALTNEPFGWPVYALCRKATDMNWYKGRAFNWMEFRINSATGNFAAGFAAFDTDAGGRLYGAGYNDRAERESWLGFDKGMKNINDQSPPLGTGSFVYNPSLVANSSGSLTLIGTETGDFALDFGPNQGAGFAVRQAASKDWSPNYNGTYFALVYENRAGSNYQTMDAFRFQASGNGSVAGAHLGPNGQITPFYTGSLAPLDGFQGGPHYNDNPPYTAIEDFKRFSGCASAQSGTVQNAYQCHGGFIAHEVDGSEYVLTVFFDPDGRFLFFCMFEKDAQQAVTYRFGFGIKDPNYQG